MDGGQDPAARTSPHVPNRRVLEDSGYPSRGIRQKVAYRAWSVIRTGKAVPIYQQDAVYLASRGRVECTVFNAQVPPVYAGRMYYGQLHNTYQ